MHECGGNRGQGLQHKEALEHLRVGDLELIALVYDLLIVQEDVNIDGAILIGFVGEMLMPTPQSLLYGLRPREQFERRERRVHNYCRIEKRVRRAKAPRVGFYVTSNGRNRAHFVSYLTDSKR